MVLLINSMYVRRRSDAASNMVLADPTYVSRRPKATLYMVPSDKKEVRSCLGAMECSAFGASI